MNFDAFMTSFIGAGEIFLVVLITVLSIKYKKYYCAVLSVLQTGLVFWYEFASGKEAVSNLPGFYIDRLTVIMVLIIAIVGTLITVYACGYMSDYHNHHTDVKDRRRFFFAIMYIFIGAMFGLCCQTHCLGCISSGKSQAFALFFLSDTQKRQRQSQTAFVRFG